MNRPNFDEYNPYFQRYLDLVPEGDFASLLHQSEVELVQLFSQIPELKHDYNYASGKWTIKQVLFHIIDTERVFAYRSLVAARGDSTTALMSYDDDHYVSHVDVSKRTLASLVEEFRIVRRATESIFEHLSDDQSKFKANAISYPITARALGYILIGHIIHHLKIVKELYLKDSLQ
jgi:uncharacterized damage-inducible protein DinB